MADVATPQDVAAPVEVAAAAAPAAPVEMDVMTALKEVLKKAMHHDGLKRGLHEVAKTLDKKTARLCCLATDCDEPSYTRLIKALCDVRGIPLVMAPTAKDLGEWVGLCKIDKEGKPRKVVSCSCAAVTDYGEDTPALNVLLEHIKSGFGKE